MVRSDSPPPPLPAKPPVVSTPIRAPLITHMNDPLKDDPAGSTSVLMGLKVMSEIFLSCLVLLCTVFSKLSLVGLTDDLSEVTRLLQNGSGSDPSIVTRGVTVYWQLLLVLLIPNCITFCRSMLFGLVGKSSQSFPFPHQRAFIMVSIAHAGSIM